MRGLIISINTLNVSATCLGYKSPFISHLLVPVSVCAFVCVCVCVSSIGICEECQHDATHPQSPKRWWISGEFLILTVRQWRSSVTSLRLITDSKHCFSDSAVMMGPCCFIFHQLWSAALIRRQLCDYCSQSVCSCHQMRGERLRATRGRQTPSAHLLCSALSPTFSGYCANISNNLL